MTVAPASRPRAASCRIPAMIRRASVPPAALLFALLAALPLAGCFSTGIPELGQRSMAVTGTVMCRERMFNEPPMEIVVELIDPTRDEEFPLIIAQQTSVSPSPFLLEFSPALIDPRHDYAVRARMIADDGVVFHTAEPALVITHGRPNHVEPLNLVRVDDAPQSPAATDATP